MCSSVEGFRVGFIGVLIVLAFCVLGAAAVSGLIIAVVTHRERKRVRADIAADEAENT